MADRQVPRIRTSYLLGLSNKPFKDPPKPPPLNSYRRMLTTPGAALEWAASDGRRGTLTGQGKPRLLNALDAAAAAKNQAKTTNQPTKAPNEAKDEAGGQSNDSGEIEYKKGVSNEYGFTDEQDKTIMRMKNENPGTQWDRIAEATGKNKDQCKERFQQIKPDGWKPANIQGKGGKKGGGQGNNQGNGQKQHAKGQNQIQSQNKQEEQKKDDKTEEVTAGDGWPDTLGGIFGGVDDNKSSASNKGSKKDDGATGDVGGWGTADLGAATGNDNNDGMKMGWDNDNSGRGQDWNNFANDNNAGVTNTWDDNTWKAEPSKEDNKDKKSEEEKEKDGKGNDKSKKKESEPNIAADQWGSGGFDIGGDATATRWDGSNWDGGGKEHKKSENKKSELSTSSASKSGSNNGWGDTAVTGGNDWGVTDGNGGAASTWGDNKANTGGGFAGWGDDSGNASGAKEPGGGGWAGWAGAASPKKVKTSNDKSKRNDMVPHADTWGDMGATRAWPQNPASEASSNDREKHRSSRRHSDCRADKHRSHRHHSSSHLAEYKVAPDNTFSQDELKLVARILQQDCSMVWERVSWRFKDKTGRNLPPDVFEKKITGKLKKERRL
ncbi:hypothetical protein SLS60_008484 [Paraconiothyrium brasiliense]|uniref:Myb-like domain-containing protein n=1 Tax=Paraconiothyrium brasiliense TaxID=300254 RepID=A0ABR3R0P1_9PLEO